MYEIKLLINNEWTAAMGGAAFPVYDPSTGEQVGLAPQADARDVEAAFVAAHSAFPAWSALPAAKRGALLRRGATLARERKEELARLLTLEQGKPLGEARGEVEAAAQALEYFAEEARRAWGDVIPTDSPGIRSLVLKQSLGVVAAITPWNYPVSLLSWKVAPALAAGCTVVAKPASVTPLAAAGFARCLVDAGVPAGAINVVTGPGSVVGVAMVENPLCAKVTFTGETATGQDIMRRAAGRVTRVSLELGGHCPLIVCADADLEAAAQGAVYRSFRNMGQICNAVNRIYVEASVAETFVDLVVRRAQALTIGNGLERPDVDLGPMTTAEGRARTKAHIADARERGARLLCGGKEPAGEQFRQGLFFEPAVLVDVDHTMRVMQEETFGPVAPIMRVGGLDEAIALANDSVYGLVAYLYTSDLRKAMLAAERLQCGTVGVNNVVGGETPYPYGGWKQSGVGIELSRYGLNEYLAVKHVRLNVGG